MYFILLFADDIERKQTINNVRYVKRSFLYLVVIHRYGHSRADHMRPFKLVC